MKFTNRSYLYSILSSVVKLEVNFFLYRGKSIVLDNEIFVCNKMAHKRPKSVLYRKNYGFYDIVFSHTVDIIGTFFVGPGLKSIPKICRK